MRENISRMNIFNLAIGPYTLAVKCDDQPLYDRLVQFYAGFMVDRMADFAVSIQVHPGNNSRIGEVAFGEDQITLNAAGYEGIINLRQLEGQLNLFFKDAFVGTDYFLRVAAAGLAYLRNGLMIHAAGIERDGGAYLFVGKSGIGKTTVARNSPIGSVLNDDLLFVFPQGKSWLVYSAPFYNQTQVKPRFGLAPLKRIYFLVQDRDVYLEEINPISAVAMLLANVPVLVTNPRMLGEIFSRCDLIVRSLHPYRLHFLPDDTFWEIIR